ncbi:hypothetical protein [[Scytonema hofmanni] UTEX B 1581]|nr:hypothetical protein [[Scytonema hofmanni] UTEX B 1581]
MGNGQWAMGIKEAIAYFTHTMPHAPCPMPIFSNNHPDESA